MGGNFWLFPPGLPPSKNIGWIRPCLGYVMWGSFSYIPRVPRPSFCMERSPIEFLIDFRSPLSPFHYSCTISGKVLSLVPLFLDPYNIPTTRIVFSIGRKKNRLTHQHWYPATVSPGNNFFRVTWISNKKSGSPSEVCMTKNYASAVAAVTSDMGSPSELASDWSGLRRPRSQQYFRQHSAARVQPRFFPSRSPLHDDYSLTMRFLQIPR